MFVSEGEPGEKKIAISKSPYLKFAYRKLEESERPLVIYGWSISGQDDHILSALHPRSTGIRKRLAMSIYVGDKSEIQLEEEVHSIQAKLAGHQVTFFDSSGLFAY